MNSRTHENHPSHQPRIIGAPKGLTILKSIMPAMVIAIVLGANATAAELPVAPSAVGQGDALVTAPLALPYAPEIAPSRPLDMKFASLALVSAGSTFADSYTTLFARQNWLAHKQGVCNIEVQSPYLYGTHPTVGRAYAVASAKSVGSLFAAYYLRKHHSRFWSLPLVGNSFVSLEGVTQNMIACNR